MLSRLVRQILQATVYDVAIETPLDAAPRISEKLNNNIRFKREDLQPVFSFKLRGAYNRISQLPQDQLKRGVITASAGNHAQGVALSGQKLGIRAIIVMPKTTPDIKVQAVKRLGGEVVLHGDSFDVANKYAIQRAQDEGMTFIPPYDDELVIAGQGTIAMELVQQWRKMEYVFVAVGGGGLISGVAAFLGEVAPHVKVVAVEPEEAACLKIALDTGERKRLPQVGLFVDGVAVAQLGEIPFDVCRMPKSDNSGPVVEPDVVTCSNDEVCAAIKDVYDETRTIVEPAGALAVAGMKKYIEDHNLQGKNCVAILCGANMNFDRLRYIAERTEIGEKKEAIFGVTIPERTGAFLDFCRSLKGRNITEFNYRINTNPNYAHHAANIFVGIALKEGEKERKAIHHIRSSREGTWRCDGRAEGCIWRAERALQGGIRCTKSVRHRTVHHCHPAGHRFGRSKSLAYEYRSHGECRCGHSQHHRQHRAVHLPQRIKTEIPHRLAGGRIDRPHHSRTLITSPAFNPSRSASLARISACSPSTATAIPRPAAPRRWT